MTTPLTIFGTDCVLWCAADLACTIGTTPKASGTAPPAVTWASNLSRVDTPCIICDASGTATTATFKWSLDGGSTFQNTGKTAAQTVTLMTAANAPIPTFPAGSYTLNNRWDARVNIFTDQAATPHSFQNGTQSFHPLLLNNFANGIRGLQFNGTASQLTTALALPKPSTQSAYISGIVRQDAGNAGGLYGMSNGTQSWRLTRAGASPNIGVDGVGNTTGALTIGTVGRVEVGVRTVTQADGYLTAISTVTGANTDDVALVASTLTLGFASGTGFGSVTWGEIIIVQRAVTRSERDQVQGYLATKWGLSTVGVVTSVGLSASQAQTPSFGRTFSIPGVSQTQIATAIKSIGMIRAAAQTQAPIKSEALGLARAAAQAQAPAHGYSLPAISGNQVQAPRIIRAAALTRAAAQAQAPKVIRNAGVIRAVAQAQTATAARSVTQRVYAAVQAQFAALTRSASVVRSATQSQTVAVARGAGVVRSAAQSQVAAISRAYRVTFSAPQAQTGTVTTLKTRIYEAVQRQVPSITRSVSRLAAAYTDLRVLVRPLVIAVAGAPRALYTDLKVLVRPLIVFVKGSIK